MAAFQVTSTNAITRAGVAKKRKAGTPWQFASESELLTLSSNWPLRRLVQIWNTLPGVIPVVRFAGRRIAVARIWREISKQNPRGERVLPAPKSSRQEASRPALPQAKGARIVALLVRPSGATLAEIIAATGWQPHTVRGFISAQIRKRMGYDVQSIERTGMRVYRILPTQRRKSAPKAPDSRLQK